MSKLVSEEEATRMSKLSHLDDHPSLMAIPAYAELQKERFLKRDMIKARFYNVFAPHDPSAMRVQTRCTQTSLDFIDSGTDIQLRAELASKDKVILSLKEKVSHIEKLNAKLNRQLMKSSFAHSDKDEDIANLKTQLAELNLQLKMKDVFLVDHEGTKKREAEMVGKLAKQHMVILRLSQSLNTCRKHYLDATQRPINQFPIDTIVKHPEVRRTDWDDEPAVPEDGEGQH